MLPILSLSPCWRQARSLSWKPVFCLTPSLNFFSFQFMTQAACCMLTELCGWRCPGFARLLHLQRWLWGPFHQESSASAEAVREVWWSFCLSLSLWRWADLEDAAFLPGGGRRVEACREKLSGSVGWSLGRRARREVGFSGVMIALALSAWG